MREKWRIRERADPFLGEYGHENDVKLAHSCFLLFFLPQEQKFQKLFDSTHTHMHTHACTTEAVIGCSWRILATCYD